MLFFISFFIDILSGKGYLLDVMKQKDIIQALATRKGGQFVSLTVNRPAKARVEFKALDLRKRSNMTLQLASYGKRSPVAAAVLEGVRQSPETPAWVDRVEKVGSVRFWHKGEQVYLAAPVVKTGKAEWLDKGEVVEQSVISSMLLGSETKEKPSKESLAEKGQVRFVAVKVENIESIA